MEATGAQVTAMNASDTAKRFMTGLACNSRAALLHRSHDGFGDGAAEDEAGVGGVAEVPSELDA